MRQVILCFVILLGSTIAAAAQQMVPADASQVVPLSVGQPMPSVTVRNPDGSTHQLGPGPLAMPTVIVFYRGGWCPYCNRHFGALKAAEPELQKQGFDVIFISADRPELLYTSLKEPDVHYTLLSDSTMAAARAYHVAFHVDEKAMATFKQYGVDIEKASGEKHHLLPVPAVFIVDRSGIIRFVHANPDFTTRITPEELLAAADKVRKGG